MARALVRDVLREAAILLKDPGLVHWTAAELVGYMSEGQRAIAKYVPMACSRVDAIKLRPGYRQSIEIIPEDSIIPGDGSLPRDVRGLFLNDIICNMGADGTRPGDAVSVVLGEMLDGYDRGWRGRRSTGPIEHFIFDPRTPQSFEVYPPPGPGGAWVEASYIELPADIPAPEGGEYGPAGSSTQTLSIGDRWRDDLLNFTLARSWMKDAEEAGNAANVQLYAGLFINSINAQVAALTGQNPNLKMLPMIPDIPAAAR